MNERRDLVAVGDLIDQVLGKVARADVAPIVQLRRSWDQVAGEWAVRCSPVGIRNGVLTVEVGSGMDASKLRFDGERLVTAARAHLAGDVAITRLAIRVRRSS
jgi:hypothetical protein